MINRVIAFRDLRENTQADKPPVAPKRGINIRKERPAQTERPAEPALRERGR